MARTVYIDINWSAGFYYYYKDSIQPSYTSVKKPYIEDTLNSAEWQANNIDIIGSAFSVNYNELMSLVNEGSNIKVFLELYASNPSGASENYINIRTHNITGEPVAYSSAPRFIMQGSKNVSYTPNENWTAKYHEYDITDMITENLYFMSGIAIAPGLPKNIITKRFEEVKIRVEGDFIPAIPTIITPIGGVVKDRTKPIEFKWLHNGALAQAGFNLRYRRVGTSEWTEYSFDTSYSQHIINANSLSIGQYEWQVRTKHSETEVSPYSSLQVFNVAGKTNAPTIISPTTGETISSKNLYIEWEEIVGQTDVEIELIESEEVIKETGITGSANSVFLTDWLENNKSYIVRLRTLANGEFWSDWAEVNINILYTPPVKPVLEIVANNEFGRLDIQVINNPPTGNQPNVSKQELYKKIEGEWRKIQNVEINGLYLDYAVASEVESEYKVKAIADNESAIFSDISTGLLLIDKSILSLASNPEVSMRISKEIARSETQQQNVAQRLFAGRKLPTSEFGDSRTKDIDITFLTTREEYDILMSLITAKETLLYRDTRGRKMYATIGITSISDEPLKRYQVSLTLNEVYFKEGLD